MIYLSYDCVIEHNALQAHPSATGTMVPTFEFVDI
jgi:hypothetical protein